MFLNRTKQLPIRHSLHFSNVFDDARECRVESLSMIDALHSNWYLAHQVSIHPGELCGPEEIIIFFFVRVTNSDWGPHHRYFILQLLHSALSIATCLLFYRWIFITSWQVSNLSPFSSARRRKDCASEGAWWFTSYWEKSIKFISTYVQGCFCINFFHCNDMAPNYQHVSFRPNNNCIHLTRPRPGLSWYIRSPAIITPFVDRRLIYVLLPQNWPPRIIPQPIYNCIY